MLFISVLMFLSSIVKYDFLFKKRIRAIKKLIPAAMYTLVSMPKNEISTKLLIIVPKAAPKVLM
jgi:hypothetical protein